MDEMMRKYEDEFKMRIEFQESYMALEYEEKQLLSIWKLAFKSIGHKKLFI